MAKRADSTHVPRRSPDWLKFKCSLGQESVVGGYTEPAGSRVGLGALLVAITNGVSWSTPARWHRFLHRNPAVAAPATRRSRDRQANLHRAHHGAGRPLGAPQLVAEVVFSEWTADGKLRHPRFEGLRTDKAASDVQRERPVGQRQA